MTKQEFLEELREMLQLEDAIAEDTRLAELEEWDSLAFMILIAFFDKNFGIRLTFEELARLATPADLINLSSGNIS